jgi:hypothetical protein
MDFGKAHEYLELMRLSMHISCIFSVLESQKVKELYNVRNNGLGNKDLFSCRVNTFLMATTGSDFYCCQTSLLSREHWGILYPGVKRSLREVDHVYTSNIYLS